MGLSEYQCKRNFKKTPEPKGDRRSIAKKNSKHPIFIVQKHAASHLHYDFRLEMNGVLKSWAVPKGPCLDPKQKRLAMHVEDHPLSYASFEGVIPKEQYGGGTVMLWDQGTWEPVGDVSKTYHDGALEFILHGKKLKGKWKLLQMKAKTSEKKSWLLIKSTDTESRDINNYDILKEKPLSVVSKMDLTEIAENENTATPYASIVADLKKNSLAKSVKVLPTLHPQLATLVNKVPEGEQWLHEVKYDGYRLLTFFQKNSIKFITRNGNDWSNKFPQIVDVIKSLALTQTVLDGEVVAFDENNHIDFQALQNAIHFKKTAKLGYYIFDMPFCMGFDIRKMPLLKRKKLLEKILKSQKLNSIVQYSDYIKGEGNAIWETSCKLGLEGIVSKHCDGVYETKRSKNWLKVKCINQQEFLIIGFTKSSGREFGSLLLGYYDQDSTLHYAGHVGTGFSRATLKQLNKKLTSLIQAKSHFKKLPVTIHKKLTTWVKAELIAEIKFSEWTEENVLRHPVFLGLRTDKQSKEIIRELPAVLEVKKTKISKAKSVLEKSDAVITKGTLTNRNKIIFTEKNITKGELANYYLNIHQWILPHIINRPLMLLRCPQGQSKKCFFQKHWNENLSKDINSVVIQEKHAKDSYLYIKNKSGLLALTQLGVIEIHAWNSNIKSLEKPDRMIFDLDPDPAVQWERTLEVAYRLREYLLKQDLQSFVKTSGKKGLHIVVPLKPTAGWDTVKEYAAEVAHVMAREYPKDCVATMTKAKRVNKIFIDYFRNTRGATTVAPYSCRANVTASVSLPMTWSQLSETTAANNNDIELVVKKFKTLSSDPWEAFFTLKQTLP